MPAKLNFSLTQLEYALAVHRLGHFSLAARHCHVTQPTLSMQIRKLEESLGAVIFDRGKKPILLTETGRRLIEQMQLVLGEARKIGVLLEESQGGALRGELLVGVIPTVAPYLLPRLLPVMQKRFPEIRLQLRELETARILEALQSDEVDAGILAVPLHEAAVREHPLYWEPFSLLCRKDHELARLKKIRAGTPLPDDIWLLKEGHCLRDQVLDFCSIKKRRVAGRPFEFESGSLETLKNLVSSYGGYTLLPELATEHLGARVALLPFERPIPARRIGTVSRREHYKAQLLQALEEAVSAAVPEALRRLSRHDFELVPVS